MKVKLILCILVLIMVIFSKKLEDKKSELTKIKKFQSSSQNKNVLLKKAEIKKISITFL